MRLEPCSGQSGRGVLSKPRKNDWGIWDLDALPYWRATDKRGRIRLFPTHEAAMRAIAKLNRNSHSGKGANKCLHVNA